MVVKARAAGLVVVVSLALSLAFVARAQDVAVDAAGQNKGNLTGALKFGGPEPIDLRLCETTHFGGHGGDCPPGPTLEGIASARLAIPIGLFMKPAPNQFGLDLYTDGLPRLSVTHGGRIGIGDQAPAFDVHIRRPGDVQIALESTDAGHRLWTIQSSGVVDPSKVGTFQIIDRDQNIQRLGIDAQGLVSVKALQITGGADLAEPFRTPGGLAPGSLVVIDDAQPGQLIPSTRAYDRRVAGVISGANDIHPGVSLEALGAGDGRQPVTLTGRVYALADASNGPIRPGDLLTTSGQPFHAMRATDMRKAQGAIIGKAMSGLDHGSGLVLVLVSLQ